MPFAQFKNVSPKQRDTGRFELKAGTVELRFSNRRSGDTLSFAVLSGIRFGAPGSDQSDEIAPGEGYLIHGTGGKDSVYFQVGAARFRGTANDVFMSGVLQMLPHDSAIKMIPVGGDSVWRMALTSRDTVP